MSDAPATRAASSLGVGQLESGRLGVFDLVFFVVAAAAPLTVMAGVAPLAIQFNGLGAPGGYLFAGIVLTLFAVGFTAMSRYVRNAGAFYAYIARDLGKPLGVGAALLAVFSYNAIEIGLVGALAFFTATTVEDLFGLATRWEIWAFLSIAIIGWLGYRRVTLSAKVLGVALGLEVAILLVLAVPVLLTGGAAGFPFESFAPQNIFTSGAGAVFVLSFGAFIGFEATAIYSEEARDPGRTVPLATYIAVGFLALFYTLITWTIIVAFGPERALSVAEQNPEGMFFAAATDYVGRWASIAMRVLIITSAFAATLAFHNAAARSFYALGRERVLPAALGRTHLTTHSPWVGGLTQTALAGWWSRASPSLAPTPTCNSSCGPTAPASSASSCSGRCAPSQSSVSSGEIAAGPERGSASSRRRWRSPACSSRASSWSPSSTCSPQPGGRSTPSLSCRPWHSSRRASSEHYSCAGATRPPTGH